MRAALFVLLTSICCGQSRPDVEAAARAVLDKHCISCHGAAQMSGLDVRERTSLLKGGKRGAALVPGKAADSLLLKAVLRTGDLQMPPGKKGLEESEVTALRAWIDAGARWSGPASSAEPSWWSFRKPRRPSVPGGARTPIDGFILAKLTEKKLRPVGTADKRTLIRRAYMDLHGLPPAPEDVDKFVADADPAAYEKLIDKLLASPRYGERWGRHWLDVVRYADTGGFETDVYFPNAWRYRDYVIKSFNEDKPYDQFVKEQIAGDEIWPDNLDLPGGFEIPKEKQEHLEARIGTGMYTIGPAYHEAALFGEQVRYEWLTDAVDTTAEAFLGLTLGCSRCHDHKFDPLTQKDYHAMMAVFAASEEREVPVISKFSIFGFKSGYPRYLKVEELKAAVNRLDRAARDRFTDRIKQRFPKEVRDAFDVPRRERTPQQKELAAQIEKAIEEARLEEEDSRADLSYTDQERQQREKLLRDLGEASIRANPVMQTATVLGPADLVPDVYITHRGEWRAKGEKVGPALPVVLSGGRQIADLSHRRKELALWLTQPDHPLTARVMVNRVWHWHFGRGIVATPGDFGRQGEEPTHPELLDWLATEFVEQGWSIKKLHKTIMLSDTYQRSSAFDESNAKVDANNRYLWRMNRRRVEAETLRDSVLAVSGALNTKMGGRAVIPPLTKEEMTGLWEPNQWPVSLDPAEHGRRSVYLYVKRSFPNPMLSTFDTPDSAVSCSRRDSTTVAPQALTLMNGEFMVSQAKTLAARLRKDGTEPAAWIRSAWRLAFGRDPSATEQTKALELFSSGATDEALARLSLVVLNMNEFVYID